MVHAFVPWNEIHDAGLDVSDFDDDMWDELRAYYDHTGEVPSHFDEVRCGVYEANSEDEAIGEYLYSMSDDSVIPEPYRNYIDWTAMGRDERLSGYMFAIPCGSFDFYVFRSY